MTKTELIQTIKQDIEWLSTTNGDEVECISIENLEHALTRFLNQRVLLSEEHPKVPLKKDMLNYPHKQLNIFGQ